MSDFCPIQKKCNSCQLRNLSDLEQLRYKEKKCRRLLGGLCTVKPITPSPKTVGYRNKAQFVFRRNGKAGLLSGVYRSTDRSAALTPACALCTDSRTPSPPRCASCSTASRSLPTTPTAAQAGSKASSSVRRPLRAKVC